MVGAITSNSQTLLVTVNHDAQEIPNSQTNNNKSDDDDNPHADDVADDVYEDEGGSAAENNARSECASSGTQ